MSEGFSILDLETAGLMVAGLVGLVMVSYPVLVAVIFMQNAWKRD